MEERIIKRIRANKRRLYRLYKIIKNNIDMEYEMIDSESLLTLILFCSFPCIIASTVLITTGINNSKITYLITFFFIFPSLTNLKYIIILYFMQYIKRKSIYFLKFLCYNTFASNYLLSAYIL